MFWGPRQVRAPALRTIAELVHKRQGGSMLFQHNNGTTGSPLAVNAFGAQ